jgi:hypothetical protein
MYASDKMGAKREMGLFKGPKPGLKLVADMQAVGEIMKHQNRFMVLTWDGAGVVTKGNEANDFSDHISAESTLSISESKGLEFDTVIILNFFKNIPADDQDDWRDFLNKGDDVIITTNNRKRIQGKNIRDYHPQIETQMKLLYTAVTRCRNHLVFVETGKQSVAGKAFFEWLTKTDIAEEFRDIEGGVLMSAEEWTTRGIDFMANLNPGMEEAHQQGMVQKAINCFKVRRYVDYVDL